MSWTKNNEWLKPDEDRDIRWASLRRFVASYKPFRGQLALAATLSVLGAVTAFGIPVLFRVVQEAIVARDGRLLAWALGGFLAIMLVEVVATYGIRVLSARVSSYLNRDLVLLYYRKILNLAVEHFIAFRRRTNLYQRIIDAMSITLQFTRILVRGGQLAIVVLIVSGAIFLVSPTILGVLALGSGVLFVHVLIQARKLAALRQIMLGVNYPLVGKMSEIINGLFTIKALAASLRVTSDVNGLVTEKTRAELDEQVAEVRSDQISQAIRAATLVLAVGVSARLMMSGALTVADVFSLYILANLLLQPVSELAIYYQLLSRLSVNVNKFYDVLDLPDEASETRAQLAARNDNSAEISLALPQTAVLGPEAQATSGAHKLSETRDALAQDALEAEAVSSRVLACNAANRFLVDRPAREKGHIIFRDVSFAYQGGGEVLRGIDLEVLPGEKISLIGRSGVGKTTLLRLLLGFLQPQRGQILVDGVDITALEDKNEYRRQFGVVSQKDFLFRTDLRENMAFGLDDTVSDERIIEALRLVGLWDEIHQLEKGLGTDYSEDLFSGGQKQRLFIARALLRDPSIVLLDEPTSALDFESEAKVMKAIELLVGTRTTITIAHRLSTVRQCDRVVVLHGGRVQTAGSHDQLYANDNYYRSLCDYNSFVV